MSKVAKIVGSIVSFAVAIFVAPFNPALAVRLVQLGNYLLLSAALDVVNGLLTKKPRLRRLGQDIEYFGTVEPRRIIYGQMRVSGMNVIPPWTSGDGNKFLHQALALAGHEVHDITDVYFNQDTIASANIGAVSGTLSDGVVSSGTYADKAWIRRYKGTTGQTADYILDTAFSDWTSNHRGREIAYLALQFELDEEVYKNGKPDVSCLVQGKKCYDPRLDSSPGANPTNASYIAYTKNPALCLADYLTSATVGIGESPSRIDWDLVVAAANECDEDVLIPPASPTTQQDRYTCSIVLEVAATDQEVRANIRALAGAMMGHVVYSAGKWRMYAGAAASSSFDLTEDDLVGKVTIRTEIPSNEKHNYVRGQFVDASRNYQLSEFEPRSNSSYESNDGERKPVEVDFPACTNQYEAQRNALIVLKRSRRKRQLRAEWGMSAFKIKPWSVGTITCSQIGWASQPVRCTAWSFNVNGTIDATFLEEDSTDWNDPAVGDYTVPSIGSGPSAGNYIPSPPLNFTATPVVDGILFQWEPPQGAPVGLRYTIYEYTSATPFASATAVAVNLIGTSRTIIKSDTTTRYYWITAKAHVGGPVSGSEPAGDGVSSRALSITTGFRATVSPSSHFKTLIGTGSGTTTNQSTVTPINGVPGYTYSWARISGSTKVSVIASTSQTTGFSASGVTNEELASALFRCTVTDSTGGTPLTTTVDVNVSFLRDDSFGS